MGQSPHLVLMGPSPSIHKPLHSLVVLSLFLCFNSIHFASGPVCQEEAV